jgi:folate-binding protein YgfZ
VSTESGIADLSASRTRLRVTGDDRATFLHGQCTHDVNRLQPGQSCYAAFLNAKGKMRGEGHVICLPDAFLLETSLGLQASLEKFIITEDVAIEDVSATLGEWLVVGALPMLPTEAVTFPHPLGIGVISDEPLTATLSNEDLEVMRVEAGVPRWGADMDDSMIPIEAGLEASAISYDKGCYIGQETIARIRTYGHVNRRLVQVTVIGDQLPVKGDRILAGDEEVGHVTSAARSIRLGKTLVLGYVRREFAATGVRLTVGQRSAEVLKICGQ